MSSSPSPPPLWGPAGAIWGGRRQLPSGAVPAAGCRGRAAPFPSLLPSLPPDLSSWRSAAPVTSAAPLRSAPSSPRGPVRLRARRGGPRRGHGALSGDGGRHPAAGGPGRGRAGAAGRTEPAGGGRRGGERARRTGRHSASAGRARRRAAATATAGGGAMEPAEVKDRILENISLSVKKVGGGGGAWRHHPYPFLTGMWGWGSPSARAGGLGTGLGQPWGPPVLWLWAWGTALGQP